MLQILNKTPFQAALTLMTDQHGVEKVVIAIKGTFTLPSQKEKVHLSENQLPVLLHDEYYGEPGVSSIKYPVDLVLGKKNTDIGLIGKAISPNGAAVKQLPILLKLGQVQKSVMIFGDRYWEKRTMMPGFRMTEPIPFLEMPLIYERAFGGEDKSHRDEKEHGWCPHNPIGTGFRLNDEAVGGQRLPNIEEPAALISKWVDKPPVAGFGFLDGHWQPRVSFTGTYDDHWRKNQCPLLPDDFDLRFFNAAHPDLTAKGFLHGGEPVQLIHLSKKGSVEFNLPKIDIGLIFRLGEKRIPGKAELWTIVFEPGEDRFYMVWGGSCSIGKQPSQLRYVKIDASGEDGLPGIVDASTSRK